MGSGNSRLDAPEGEAQVPQKIKTSFIGKIEELRNRKNGEGTLSKKQLLNDSEEIDADSQSSHGIETGDSQKETLSQTEPRKEEPAAHVTTSEKLSRVVPMPNPESEIVEESDPNKGKLENVDSNQDKVVLLVDKKVEVDAKSEEEKTEKVETEAKTAEEKTEKVEAEEKKTEKVEAEAKTEKADAEVKTGERKAEKVETEEGKKAEQVEEVKRENEREGGAKSNVDDGDDDEDNDDNECGRFLCPGSPSFRIYCIEADKKKEEEESKSPTIIIHQKSRSADSVETTASAKSRMNKVLEAVEIESGTKRKGNKKKFGAMKTLLKVKSCYHPMCTCTGYDRNIILAEKTEK